MKQAKYNMLILLLIVLLSSCESAKEEVSNERPNIIYILADDLGYGELGCYGQEKIETPHIDQLAAEGIRFTQHYTGAPVCAPARCVLLTGKHSGHAFVRGNDEWGSRGNVWSYEAMIADSTLEGQRPLPLETQTIAKYLKSAGYQTGMIGKWGLGAPHTQSIPNKMGFDYFLGYNCQRQAHTYYPVHLYENEKRLYLNNDTVAPNTKLEEGADPYEIDSYTNYQLNDYAPDVMFEGMMNFIDENKEDPFFFYWASPIPHVALQAPQKWVDYYHRKFGDEEPYLGNKGYFPTRYPNATYAAMISYLDERVGQLVQKLKEEGLYENTLIIFTSDNGPTYAGGVDAHFFNSAAPFNNDYGWTKGFVHEGGIRVPMIASWPKKIAKGILTEHISSFVDVLPTLGEVSGAKALEEVDGISYLPTLLNNGQQLEHEYIYWEFSGYEGQQAVRWGDWKAIRKNIRIGNMELELYNLQSDIREAHNIALDHPEIVEKIKQFMIESHQKAETERFQMSALGD